MAAVDLPAALREARAMMGVQAAPRTLNPHRDATVTADKGAANALRPSAHPKTLIENH
jgi:hypothetical protein